MRRIEWRRGPAGFSCENAKVRFRNCEPKVEEGVVCARLGESRAEPSSLSYCSDSISVCAHVRGGPGRQECQDSAFVYAGPRCAVVGVFDGYGPAGTAISEQAADAMVELAATGFTFSPLRRIVGLFSAQKGPEPPFDRGGATASCAIVERSGAFAAFSVSDSAAFKLHDGSFRRLIGGHHLDYRGRDVRGKPMDSYFGQRNLVSGTICYLDANSASIASDGGIMHPGEGLLLSTDGLTKNLAVRFDAATGKIVDNSGCDDLSCTLERSCSPEEAVRSLLSDIGLRLAISMPAGKPLISGPDTAIVPDPDDLAIIALCV